jgi:hypothetical protein
MKLIIIGLGANLTICSEIENTTPYIHNCCSSSYEKMAYRDASRLIPALLNNIQNLSGERAFFLVSEVESASIPFN